MTWEPLVAFAGPGVAAVLLWLLPVDTGRRRALAIAFALALTAVAARMVALAADGAVGVHAFGNWQPPYGIVFVVDRLAALLVLLGSGLLVATVIALNPAAHGAATVDRALPLLFVATFALHGAFMTGDLFNLFVMFELVLMASYLLLQVPGTARSRQAALSNVVINLIASLLFFAGVGVLYGLCGSVNLADLAVRITTAPAAPRLAALTMLVVAFSIKAGLAPLAFWLPGTYPVTSAPVAAFFAGIMTKLGAYALMRTLPLLMGGTGLPELLVGIGGLSAILGVLAALSQYELRRLLAFHSVSQMGYIVAPLALLTVGGVTAAIYFLVHHAIVKASLYLVADELEREHGTRDLRAMTAGSQNRGLAPLFFVAAMTLAGLPPSSGFIAKLAGFQALYHEGSRLALAALLVASLFTLASMLKIWRYTFEPVRATDGEAAPGAWPPAVTLLVSTSVALAVFAGPVAEFARATAEQTLDREGYIAAAGSARGYPAPRPAEAGR